MVVWSLRLLSILALGAGLAVSAAQARDLTIALPANINTLDPDKTTTVATDLSVLAHIYTPLVDRGPDMTLRAGLATAWVATDDRTWRFTLTPGVTFADGEPLDAAAVKWNIDRVLDPKTGARNRPWFAAIQDVRVVDATTVDVVSKAAYPDLPAQMTMFFLLPPKWGHREQPHHGRPGQRPLHAVQLRQR